MIIVCVNCTKKFNVNSDLIPINGRQIKCGSCNYSWYFKTQDIKFETLIHNKKNHLEEVLKNDNSNDLGVIKKDDDYQTSLKHIDDTDITKDISKDNKYDTEPQIISKFFSYLIVFIISIAALVVLIDTIKSPLIQIFPDLEIILFNLFETLKDIKLFIIDLT